MVYRREHSETFDNCTGGDCTPLATYVRYDGKWTKIGYFGSECKQFQLLDLEQERERKENSEDIRLARERNAYYKTRLRQIRQNDPAFVVNLPVESEPQPSIDAIKNLFDIDIESFCQLDRDMSEL